MATERTDKSASFLGSTEAIHGAWESDYLNPDLDQFYEAAFDRIVRALDPKPGDRVLDAGCGYGFHAVRLARRGLRVTGVDFSDVALGRARETVARFGLENFIHLEQGSLLALPFPDGTFDHVSCWGVLMHIPDLETALEELARVLRPGGRMAIGENNGRSLHVQVWERILRTAKRALGRRVPPWDWTPRGLEEWREEDGGGLMVRKLDPGFLAGADLARDACQRRAPAAQDDRVRARCEVSESRLSVRTRALPIERRFIPHAAEVFDLDGVGHVQPPPLTGEGVAG